MGVNPTPNCYNEGQYDLWYSFTAPASGRLDIDLANGVFSSKKIDAVAVYANGCNNLTSVACATKSSETGEFKFTVQGLVPNNTYLIQIITDGLTTSTNFTLKSVDPCQTPPPETGEIPSNTYQKNAAVTTAGTVESGSTVILKSSESITFTPGFHAKSGSNLTAQIETCVNVLYEEESLATEKILPQTTTIEGKEKNPLKGLSVYPNPTKNETTVAYQLNQPSNVSLRILNVNGQEIQNLQQVVKQSPGRHQVRFQMGNFPAGMYFILLRMENKSFSTKFVVTE